MSSVTCLCASVYIIRLSFLLFIPPFVFTRLCAHSVSGQRAYCGVNTHTHTHARVHTHTHAHSITHTHGRAGVCVHVRARALVCVCVLRVCLRACVRVFVLCVHARVRVYAALARDGRVQMNVCFSADGMNRRQCGRGATFTPSSENTRTSTCLHFSEVGSCHAWSLSRLKMSLNNCLCST